MHIRFVHLISISLDIYFNVKFYFLYTFPDPGRTCTNVDSFDVIEEKEILARTKNMHDASILI